MSIRHKTTNRHHEIRSPVPCPACGRVLDSSGVSRVDDLLTAHRRYSCGSADLGAWPP